MRQIEMHARQHVVAHAGLWAREGEERWIGGGGGVTHPDQPDVIRKVFQAVVEISRDTLGARPQVHRLLNQLRVVVKAHLLPVNRFAEVYPLTSLHESLHEGVALPLQGIVHGVDHIG